MTEQRLATVLNVDDSRPNRYVVTRALRSAGFHVIEAETGGEALRLVAERPDLVLLDVNLPDMSGLDVCSTIKANPALRAIPVVHLSATLVDKGSRIHGLETGADAYLVHPIDSAELIAIVKAFVRAREAEESMVALAEQWQTTFDAMQEGVALIDAEGRFQRCNAALAELLGRSAGDLLGSPHRDVMFSVLGVDTPSFDKTKNTFTRQAAEQKAGDRWFSVTLDPVLDRNGAFAGAAYVLTDISGPKRLAEEVKKAAEELAEKDRHKDEFLAMLSHELRNPLGTLSMALHLMSYPSISAERTRKLRSTASGQVHQLKRLVDDLLDVSRITRGKIELQRTDLDLVRLVADTVDAKRELIEAMGHTLVVTLPESAPLMVRADSARLEQVVVNLLDNAAKYTPTGGRIELCLEGGERAARLIVRDTGIGLAPDMLARIFEPFAQVAQSLARSGGGLGIGLTLVRSLVAMHGGEVFARSEGLGQGSEFVVTLPVVKVDAVAPDKPHVAVPGTTREDLRVLIVEDKPDSRELLKDLLELAGFEVVTAGSGDEGIEVAHATHPDVALVDLGLPGIDGFELARRVRAAPDTNELYLVALTGYGRREDRALSKEAGFDRHLTKPIDLDVLQEVLSSVHRRAA